MNTAYFVMMLLYFVEAYLYYGLGAESPSYYKLAGVCVLLAIVHGYQSEVHDTPPVKSA